MWRGWRKASVPVESGRTAMAARCNPAQRTSGSCMVLSNRLIRLVLWMLYLTLNYDMDCAKGRGICCLCEWRADGEVVKHGVSWSSDELAFLTCVRTEYQWQSESKQWLRHDLWEVSIGWRWGWMKRDGWMKMVVVKDETGDRGFWRNRAEKALACRMTLS